LRGEGLGVIEVDRPNRQERRRNGKSDELDAIEAARAALSGRASGIAKSADGDVEAIRALLVARRSGRNVRVKDLNQIRHLGFTAPDELRQRLRDVPADQLARTAAALRPTSASDTVTYATKLAIATPTLDDSTMSSTRWCAAARPGCSRSTASASTPPPSC
jgi:transposase